MASAHKDPRILFFLAGAVPTADEMEEIWELGNNVAHRNGSIHSGGSAPEQCDGVAGCVPKEYRKFPDGAKALREARDETIRKLRDSEDAAAEQARIAAEKADEAAKLKADAPPAPSAADNVKNAQQGEGKAGKTPQANPGAAWQKQ
jgi:hypothetical protein